MATNPSWSATGASRSGLESLQGRRKAFHLFSRCGAGEWTKERELATGTCDGYRTLEPVRRGARARTISRRATSRGFMALVRQKMHESFSRSLGEFDIRCDVGGWKILPRARHVGRNESRLSRERTGASGLSGIGDRMLLWYRRTVWPNEFGSGGPECSRNDRFRKMRSNLVQFVFAWPKQVVTHTFEIQVSGTEDKNFFLVAVPALAAKRDTGVAREIWEKST